jgi:hypothetical protein
MWSVTIDRSSLSLGALVIDGNPTATSPNGGKYHLTEEACTWPSFSMRRRYAPDSEELDGKQVLGAVKDEGQMTLKFIAHRVTTADLAASVAELEAAFSQLSYNLTVVIDGVTIGTFEAHSELPQWGELDSGKVRAKLVTGTVVVPLNPVVS